MDQERAALYMNPVPFGKMDYIDEYRAVQTDKYTYVKTPRGPSMLFDDIKDVYQMNNLVNNPEYAAIQERLDVQLKKELKHIDDEEIKPRDYYLKKFGYYGMEEFRPDYHIRNVEEVKKVITPYSAFEIEKN
jgi:hypothetical protein